jgi:hypothetical protein
MPVDRIVFILVFSLFLGSTPVMAQSFSLVTFDTADGGRIEAAWFAAGKNKAVIFAHGAIYNKESWYFLAHAQHLFQTAAREDLIERITAFIDGAP